MVKTTVQAAGFVGAGLALGDRVNGGLCGGAFLAAGGHFAVVGFGVRSGTDGARDWHGSPMGF